MGTVVLSPQLNTAVHLLEVEVATPEALLVVALDQLESVTATSSPLLLLWQEAVILRAMAPLDLMAGVPALEWAGMG